MAEPNVRKPAPDPRALTRCMPGTFQLPQDQPRGHLRAPSLSANPLSPVGLPPKRCEQAVPTLMAAQTVCPLPPVILSGPRQARTITSAGRVPTDPSPWVQGSLAKSAAAPVTAHEAPQAQLWGHTALRNPSKGPEGNGDRNREPPRSWLRTLESGSREGPPEPEGAHFRVWSNGFPRCCADPPAHGRGPLSRRPARSHHWSTAPSPPLKGGSRGPAWCKTIARDLHPNPKSKWCPARGGGLLRRWRHAVSHAPSRANAGTGPCPPLGRRQRPPHRSSRNPKLWASQGPGFVLGPSCGQTQRPQDTGPHPCRRQQHTEASLKFEPLTRASSALWASLGHVPAHHAEDHTAGGHPLQMAQEELEPTDDFRWDQLPGVTTLPTVTWPPGREVPGQSGPSKDSQGSAAQHPFPYLLQGPGFMGELPRGLPPKSPQRLVPGRTVLHLPGCLGAFCIPAGIFPTRVCRPRGPSPIFLQPLLSVYGEDPNIRRARRQKGKLRQEQPAGPRRTSRVRISSCITSCLLLASPASPADPALSSHLPTPKAHLPLPLASAGCLPALPEPATGQLTPALMSLDNDTGGERAAAAAGAGRLRAALHGLGPRAAPPAPHVRRLRRGHALSGPRRPREPPARAFGLRRLSRPEPCGSPRPAVRGRRRSRRRASAGCRLGRGTAAPGSQAGVGAPRRRPAPTEVAPRGGRAPGSPRPPDARSGLAGADLGAPRAFRTGTCRNRGPPGRRAPPGAAPSSAPGPQRSSAAQPGALGPAGRRGALSGRAPRPAGNARPREDLVWLQRCLSEGLKSLEDDLALASPTGLLRAPVDAPARPEAARRAGTQTCDPPHPRVPGFWARRAS
ncbi:collagen alpha-1(I) chain-like [Lynx canadensis]|uniref:collagen alpha-1(I) chain-like n=1 Tax=Lynx canadensis TaxID=61383 RepID=UPI0011B01802|nr:collagen alpha-1(I) chain-like [Lynx canadensis]